MNLARDQGLKKLVARIICTAHLRPCGRGLQYCKGGFQLLDNIVDVDGVDRSFTAPSEVIRRRVPNTCKQYLPSVKGMVH